PVADRSEKRPPARGIEGWWLGRDRLVTGRQAVLVLEEISINETYVWIFDAQTGQKKEVTPRPPVGAEKIAYGSALFSKDDRGIFVTTDRESEVQRLAYIDLASGRHTYRLPDVKFDVYTCDLRPAGTTLAYT